jgi:hypothetical protein
MYWIGAFIIGMFMAMLGFSPIQHGYIDSRNFIILCVTMLVWTVAYDVDVLLKKRKGNNHVN